MDLLKEAFSIHAGFTHIIWVLGLAGLVRLWKWANGMTYRGKRELAFWFTGVIGIGLVLNLISAAAARMQPAEAHGELHAGLIFAGQVPDSVQSTNSAVVGTVAGIPANVGSAKMEKGVEFMLIVRVDNSGQPSVAFNWKVYVLLPGGTRYDAIIPSVSGIGGNVIPTIIGPFKPTLDNNLLQLLNETPLNTGNARTGWILLHINGVNGLPSGSKFEVSFEDVFGRHIKLEHTWAGPFTETHI